MMGPVHNNTLNKLLSKLLQHLDNLNVSGSSTSHGSTSHGPSGGPVAYHSGPYGYYAPSLAQPIGAPLGFSYQPTQPDSSGHMDTSGQATVLPYAFTTGTLHDPASGAWNFDTGSTISQKRGYDIWAMKMEHYLAHTDYPIWEVIQNGNGPVSVTTDTSGQIKILPPKTGEEVVARERKARTTLLMAIPEDHLAKFHKMTDAKEMWNAIKSRFGGNDESKKMQKYILKQQFEGFTVSNTDGIHKGYERFQSLLSQLEIHGAGVSTEDANQKFLRSLPSAWLQVSLIMRNKPGMDSLSFDDLYNNLRVFENDVKGSTASSSNLQNVAFISENTNINQVILIGSEDVDKVDEYDLEGMDLKMASCIDLHENKEVLQEMVELQNKGDNRRRDGWNPANKMGRTGKKEESKAMVTVDGESVDWTTHSENNEDYAFMASNSSGSDTQDDKTVKLQAVPPTMSGFILPSRHDIEVDDSSYTYGPEKTQPMSEPVVNESNIEVQPKVWSDAPIIEEYESDSDDECVTVQTKGLDTPSFANKQVKNSRENVKHQSTHSLKTKDNPHRRTLKNKGIIDSGCSRHMTGNKAYLADFQDFNGGPVAFGGSKGYITGKGKIKTGKLDFEDVSFVKELQPFNLFSVSQMCDKKNKVRLCSGIFNLENIVPLGGLACLIAKATTDESNLWHRRLGHVNFKNLNRLVKGNLVRGLPTKLFQNDHTCVACQKGKQHKASCKAKVVSSISNTLQLLHMDLFGPTSVRSINHKTYCLVITDDFSRFMGFNPLVHSFCALSTLRRSGLRTASAAAKPCQGDSLEFYLITGRIPTVAAAGQRHVNSQPHAHTSYS
ncbi:putative ribonuclease H-like domain-containing protein [Tanacetum coccineum]